MTTPEDMGSVRYMVDDVPAAHRLLHRPPRLHPALLRRTGVRRGHPRRTATLLAGPASSAGRAMPDGPVPGPGGWNRIHFIVDDINAELARLRAEGVPFRNEIVTGPGARRSCWKTPRATSSNCSNPPQRRPCRPFQFSSWLTRPGRAHCWCAPSLRSDEVAAKTCETEPLAASYLRMIRRSR
jgi:catechol 2,3-dioxygenase-like lactoylglutathione lyase family enzyme